jgi:hypothetical protein
MPQLADTIGMPRRRNTEEIQQLLEQCRASGLTQAEYCRPAGCGSITPACVTPKRRRRTGIGRLHSRRATKPKATE